ncbi:glycosyltransferase family 2 protein [Photobacterium phosphoreum]|uniref:glycosyltransferase family 2 protein n=1 Tax=Photobacterium phosphoreum TaxID=659 RepID=UPI001E3031BB|nr:glycosyltransferase family 2 protein [Photobacterium phosphoreum]MCD9508246.1 glycosyltransferase [Photobacterium phosphoreum]
MLKILSIIIPVYNVELYLDECLKSVFEQVTDEVEVIIINDGSTDNSETIVKNYQSKYKFKYLNQENQGLSVARNNGIKESRGKYISFLDSDDILADNIILDIISEIKKSQCDLYKFKYIQFNDGEKINKHIEDYDNISNINSKREIIEDNSFYCWSYIFKKTLFNNIEFDCGRYFEDQLIIPIIIFNATTYKMMNQVIVYYRKRNRSITNTISLSHVDDALFGLNRYSKEYKKDNIYFSKVLAEQYISFLSKCARADHLDHLYIMKMIKKVNKLISIDMMIKSKITKSIIYKLFTKIVFYRLRHVTKKDYY